MPLFIPKYFIVHNANDIKLKANHGGLKVNKENTLNVRRLVGAIFLALGAFFGFVEAQSVSSVAMFGIVRDYQGFLGCRISNLVFCYIKNSTKQKSGTNC